MWHLTEWFDDRLDWLDDHLEWIPILFGAAIVAGIIAIIPVLMSAQIEQNAEDKRLLSECLRDGRKEYECVSMLRRHEPAAVPVFIPMPTGR